MVSDSPNTETRTLTESSQTSPEWRRTYAIGLCMGIADALPGVSGGTVALIAGIYERLITAISSLSLTHFHTLLQPHTQREGVFNRIRALADEVDAGFVLVLGAGMATAIVVVTRLVHHASEAYPALLYGFFFGLIAASALILLRTLRIQTPVQAAAGGLGFILAFMLSGTPALLGGGGLGTVFIAGAVAVSAMILPGISGSLLLVILGQYTRMATSLSGFIDALIAVLLGGSLARLTEPGVEVLVFVLGGFTGLVSVSRLIRWALAAHRRGTLAFLVMMVVGALRAPVARVAETVGFSPAIGVVFVGSAVVGVGIVLVLDWYVVDLDFDSL